MTHLLPSSRENNSFGQRHVTLLCIFGLVYINQVLRLPPPLFFSFLSLSLLVLTLFPLLCYYVLNIVIARLGEILTGRNPIMGSWIQFSRIVMEDEGTGEENYNRSDASTVYLYLCVCV
jgi:hypothetical protein